MALTLPLFSSMPHPFKWSALFLYILLNFFLFSVAKAIPANAADDSNRISLGLWRGEIIRPDGHLIVFIFQTREVSGRIIIHVINGTERLLVDNIRQQGDSLFIDMPFFDSHFSLRIVNEKTLTGDWVKISGADRPGVPFRAILINQAVSQIQSHLLLMCPAGGLPISAVSMTPLKRLENSGSWATR